MDDIANEDRLLNRLSTSLLKEGKLPLPQDYSIPAHKAHKSSFKTTRKSEYRAKSIKIETTYKISIDDEPLLSHTMVMDDGSVHCHDFPNYSFPSAVDMAKKIIDADIDFVAPDDELSCQSHSHHGGGE